MKWSFPSNDNGTKEGYSNPGHETFRNDPLQALAREICQNSLDAVDDENSPVCVEFKRELVNTNDFPGTEELLDIFKKCDEFWKNDKNEQIDTFIQKAYKRLKGDTLYILRISDYNTVGLQGAFDTTSITPWIGLVKSTGVNVKSNDTAAGSFGIGKAAAFINSDLQTVFYRTKDIEGVEACQGVASLMAFSDESYGDKDPVRRATGFYGEPKGNLPVEKMDLLDKIYKRDQVGTDIFIPGFHWVTSGRAKWFEVMTAEILENFLMSVWYGKLNVKIENQVVNKEHIEALVSKYGKSAKNAYSFSRILLSDPADVVEENLDFHGLGTIRLRLLYNGDLNKKILVVRNSGMKICDIKSLPKAISFTGILELKGDKLNKFFRKMENPQHNSWDPQRHDNPELAREYKNEVENWVKETIYKKIEEESGEETIVDIGNCLNTSVSERGDNTESKQKLVDTTRSVEISFRVENRPENEQRINNTKGQGKSRQGTRASTTNNITGSRRPGNNKATNRNGGNRKDASQSEKTGETIVNAKTRVVTLQKGKHRLFVTTDRDYAKAVLELGTVGENGNTLMINVRSVEGEDVSLKDGKIIMHGIKANDKRRIDFTTEETHNYAMGVIIHGNQE